MDYSARFLMLQELDIFSSLTHEELNHISKHSSFTNIKKEEYIYSKGENISDIYILMKGAVKIGANVDFQKSIINKLVHEGEIFGENILTKNLTRKDFAQSLANGQMVSIPKHTFEKLLMSNSAFCTKVVSHILAQLNDLETRISDFVYKKAHIRIEGFLKRLALKKGIRIGIEEILVNHTLSHSDIAHITDTSRQTVSRVLGELKKADVIHFSPRKPNKILIRKLAMLG